MAWSFFFFFQDSDLKSRRVAESNPVEQQRRQRMFGLIKNTLHKASEEQAKLNDTV